MPSDVTLEGEKVVIQGDLEVGQINAVSNQLKIKGWDLILNAPERRAVNSNLNSPRRALVHDSGDKLTINYANDYPGGVNISGPVDIGGQVTISGLVALSRIASESANSDVSFECGISVRKNIVVAPIFRGMDSQGEEFLEISQKTVQLKSRDVAHRQNVLVLDLVEEIKKLRQELNDLRDKMDHHINR
jgi:hypothetical protein